MILKQKEACSRVQVLHNKIVAGSRSYNGPTVGGSGFQPRINHNIKAIPSPGGLNMLDFRLSPQQLKLQKKAREFALKEILPVAWYYDEIDLLCDL
jgi:hypothetical protein